MIKNSPFWNSTAKDWKGTQVLIEAIKDHPLTKN